MILDYLGNPVRTTQLTQEQAAPTVGTVRQLYYDSVSANLSPGRLATLLTDAVQGDAQAYLTLAEEMEERDLHYGSVLGIRKLAVSKLSLSVESVSDDPKDEELADEVRSLLKADRINFLLKAMLDGLGKGYSATEVMWRTGTKWVPKRYVWRDPRYFQFDADDGATLRRRELTDPKGTPLAPFKFIVHVPTLKMGMPIRNGLARLACVSYMCKNFALKDWMVFADVYGLPLRLGKYGENASTTQKNALLAAVIGIGSDAGAIIPDTMDIDFIQNSSGGSGDKVFLPLAEYLDKQMSKGILGQTMTSDDGASLSQAVVHDRVRDDIRDDDAMQISQTLRDQLVKPYVDINYGPRDEDQYPTIKLFENKAEDLERLSKSLIPFIDRGLRVEASVIRDKFGIPEPEEGAEVLGALSTAPIDDDGVDGKDVDGKEAARQLAAAAKQSADDALTEAVDDQIADWENTMAPLLDPIRALAARSKTPSDFLDGLKSIDPSLDEFTETMAMLMFKARAVGDVED